MQLVQRKGEIEVMPEFVKMFKESEAVASKQLPKCFRTKREV